MNITTLKELLIEGIKKTVPTVIDRIGIYDNVIDDRSKKLIVPMYHRVVESFSDDPFRLGMCVQKKTFEKQAKYFSESFKSIQLSDIRENKSFIKDDANYVSYTFDDGYKDNILTAKPILDKYNLNATFFICCNIFTKDKQFWWDLIINSFAQTKCEYLDLSPINHNFPETKIYLNSSNRKIKLLFLLQYLWTLDDVVFIKEVAEYIELSLLGKKHTIDKLNEDDIKKLHQSGYEIAAHTLSHPNLRLISIEEQKREFVESKNILEEIIGDEIRGFAYPAGFKDLSLENLAKESGYKYAVSAVKGVNRKFNYFSIERIGMPESNVPDVKRCIYNYCKQ